MTAEDRLTATSIRSRIWQLAIVACCTLGALGLVLALSLERSREANGLVQLTHTTLGVLQSYTKQLVDAETGQRGFLLTGQDEYLAPYNQALAGSKGQLARLRELITDDAAQRKLQRLAQIFDDKIEELGETIRLAKAGKLEEALAVVREGRGRRDTVESLRLGEEIAGIVAAHLAERQVVAENESQNILAIVVIGSAMAGVLILGATKRTVSRIEGPLRNLMEGIAALADGHLDRRVDLRSTDEIGKVAKAFNDMADHLLAATRSRERIEADLARSNRQLSAEIQERTAAQARLSQSSAELERSNQELDSFAYVASHDLKAPLRGIHNLTEWIAEAVKDKSDEDTVKNLALLRNRVERLDMLLDSLLQYSRVGRLGGTPEDIDISRLIGEIAEYIAPRMGFAVTCRGDMPIFRTNKVPLEKVLRNLIGNGLKHHDRDTGAVVVMARDLGDRVEFRVEDDGPGIMPAYHERIFQMFQTLRSRDAFEGSGMGLAIVKKSVEGHSGTITVESAPPRRGTAFVFTWAKDQPARTA